MAQYCTFLLDNLHFGIEVSRVRELVPYQPMTRIPLAPNAVRGLINLRGQIMTAIDLRRRLGLPDRPESQTPMNVVVQDQENVLSLLVDEIRTVIDVDDDAFEPSPETLTSQARGMIRGAFKLNDRLLLLLDCDKTIDISLD